MKLQVFQNFKLDICFSRVGYGAIHLHQMKGYPCVFKFPEYGNLWFCDDPNHKGKCAMSKLQTYIPRGVNNRCLLDSQKVDRRLQPNAKVP